MVIDHTIQSLEIERMKKDFILKMDEVLKRLSLIEDKLKGK